MTETDAPGMPPTSTGSTWSRGERVAALVFVAWSGFLVLAILARDGWTPDNVTRVAVVAWLVMSVALHLATGRQSLLPSRRRFILTATLNALVVEVCYMPTRPLWPGLRVEPGTPLATAALHTLIDVVATGPFYLLLFAFVWWLLGRVRLGVVGGVLLCAFGMAMGDGNAFFLAAPAALWLAPWVMLNSVAALLTPTMRNHAALPATSSSTSAGRRRLWRLLTVPAIVVAYWCGGATLLAVGRALGYA